MNAINTDRAHIISSKEQMTMNWNPPLDSAPISVVLVDDQALARQVIRRSIMSIPGVEVLGEAGSADSAISVVCDLEPDVALLDVRLGKDSGLEVARTLAAKALDTKILVFSAYDDERYVRAFLRVGARGYLVKDETPHQLVNAICQVAHGWVVLSAAVASSFVKRMALDRAADHQRWTVTSKLSPREAEVLSHVSHGLRNLEIAHILGITPRTVESHVKQILRKLGVRSRTQAALMAAGELAGHETV
ncbi:MAG: response regulator transcription factor [Chloroflexi bacterium]|nr:response regulator transcription factor [Chloroflexota bacterium]